MDPAEFELCKRSTDTERSFTSIVASAMTIPQDEHTNQRLTEATVNIIRAHRESVHAAVDHRVYRVRRKRAKPAINEALKEE